MLGEKRRDWLEDVLEGDEVFVEQAALLHQVQGGGQTRQPADSKENTPSSTQPLSGLKHCNQFSLPQLNIEGQHSTGA